MSEATEKDQELVEAVKGLFRERCGEFRIEEFMQVARLLGLDVWEKRTSERPMKMFARSYPAEIFGINLRHVLNEYEWVDFYPMTDDNITVTGFWDPRKTPDIPAGYAMDESKRYLKLTSL